MYVQSRPLYTQPAYMLLTSSLPPSSPPPSFSLTQSLSPVILLKFSIYAPSPSNLPLSLSSSLTRHVLNAKLAVWMVAGIFYKRVYTRGVWLCNQDNVSYYSPVPHTHPPVLLTPAGNVPAFSPLQTPQTQFRRQKGWHQRNKTFD